MSDGLYEMSSVSSNLHEENRPVTFSVSQWPLSYFEEKSSLMKET